MPPSGPLRGRVDVRDVPYPHVPDGWLLLRVEYGGIGGTRPRHHRGTAPPSHRPPGDRSRDRRNRRTNGSRRTARRHASGGRAAHRLRPLPGLPRSGSTRMPRARTVRNRRGGRPRRLHGGAGRPGRPGAAWGAGSSRRMGGAPRRRGALGGSSADAGRRVGARLRGAGPIGILVALVAREAGAARIVIAEPKASRRGAAAACGFETVPDGVDPATWFRSTNASEGADIVFDTAGHRDVARVLPASGLARPARSCWWPSTRTR